MCDLLIVFVALLIVLAAPRGRLHQPLEARCSAGIALQCLDSDSMSDSMQGRLSASLTPMELRSFQTVSTCSR